MPKLFVRTLLVLVLALITLTLATCISAEQTDYVRYDAAKDEFQMLMVLQDIRTQDKDDAEFLQAIYKNRDHLIAPALPGGASVFPLAAFSLLRMTDAQFGSLNIFVSRPTTLDTADSLVPLNTIKIVPGTFFVQNKKLGYYQALTVPGKTIDIALDEISKAALSSNEEMIKGIDKELARRADGGKVYAWDQLKADTLKKITLEDSPDNTPPAASPATAPEEITPDKVLDVQSLNNFKQAISNKTLRIRRDKQSVSLALPFSARDSAQLVDFYKQAQKRLDEIVAGAKGKPNLAEKLQTAVTVQTLARSLTVAIDKAAPGGAGLNVSLDLLTAVKSIALLPAHRVDLNQKNESPAETVPGQPAVASAPAALDPIAYLREQKIPLNETLTAEQIVKDFNAGTLKANLSATPLKPGEGIIKPPEQATPVPAMP